MPRGKFTNKGKSRRFTNPEELEEQRRKEEQQNNWKKYRGDSLSEEEDGPAEKKNSDDSDSETESSSEDESGKAKGVSNLIQIENPNRVQKKAKKLTNLNTELATAVQPDLTRREREEIEKQRAQAFYQKMHAEGKTDQARADLARLAIIKQQREDAAKRRDLEKKVKDDAVKQRTEQTHKALGKKT